MGQGTAAVEWSRLRFWGHVFVWPRVCVATYLRDFISPPSFFPCKVRITSLRATLRKWDHEKLESCP